MTQVAQHPPDPQALKQGYEPPDVSVRGVVIFLIIFIVSGVILSWGLWELCRYYMTVPRSVDEVTSAAPQQKRFPEPQLQPNESHNRTPEEDLADLLREKSEIFKQIGWAQDPSTHAPAIPDQIIAQLAQKRRTPATAPAKGGGQ